MVIFVKQPQERELFHVSPLPRQLFAVPKKNFLFRSGKARKPRRRNSAHEWHEEAHNSCMSCVVKPSPELQPPASPTHGTHRKAAHNPVPAEDVEVITAGCPLWERGQCVFWFLIT